MSAKVGVDCKLYLKTGGTDESPTFTLVPKIGDLKNSNAATAVDSSTRESAYKLYEKGMLDVGAEFDMKSDYTDPTFVAIRDAYYARGDEGKLRFRILDGTNDEAESEGIDAYFIVTKFERNEPLDDRVTHAVELKPTVFEDFVPTFIGGEAA